jgi:hypothetical protein
LDACAAQPHKRRVAMNDNSFVNFGCSL